MCVGFEARKLESIVPIDGIFGEYDGEESRAEENEPIGTCLLLYSGYTENGNRYSQKMGDRQYRKIGHANKITVKLNVCSLSPSSSRLGYTR